MEVQIRFCCRSDTPHAMQTKIIVFMSFLEFLLLLLQITQMKIKHNPYAKAFQGPQDSSIFSR